MYVISEEITTAGQSFTYELSQFPEFTIDSSWNIESVDSILDGSNCLSAAVELIDRKTFRVTPDNADFSAYIMINLVFGGKARPGSRRRSIELRIDFVSKYIERILCIADYWYSHEYDVQFRDPTAEFHILVCGRNEYETGIPPITANWQKIVGVNTVHILGDQKLILYNSKNIKYSVAVPIFVDFSDWTPQEGNKRGFSLSGDIYALLASGKMLVPGALDSIFRGSPIIVYPVNLYSTNLIEGCYINAFSGAGTWTQGFGSANLPARVVPAYAYYYMFSNIRHFGGLSSIDAEVLTGSHNFYGMFSGITYYNSLPTVLKPRVLTPYCYGRMFAGTGWTNVRIEATTYAEGCFEGMYYSGSGYAEGIWGQTKPYSHKEICMNNDTRTFPNVTATEFEAHSFERAFKDCKYFYSAGSITLNIHKAMDYAFSEAFSRQGISPSPYYPWWNWSIYHFTNTYTGEIELGENAFHYMFLNCRTMKTAKNMSLASREDASNAYTSWLPSWVDTAETGQNPVYTYNYNLLDYAYTGYTFAEAESLIREDYDIPSIWELAYEDPIQRDLTLSFANGYPAAVDGSLGFVDVGVLIGEGYPGHGRDLTITAVNDSSTVVFSQTYVLDSSSYRYTPYVVRITPNVVREDWNLTIKADVRFHKFAELYVDAVQIQKNVSIPVDSSLLFANGYPAAVNGCFDSVDVGLLVGDGYNDLSRNINLTCYDIDGNTVFNQTYQLDSSSYKQTPYVVRITPNFRSKDYYIDVHATLNVGYVSNSVNDSEYVQPDNTLSWASGYPRLTNERSLSGVDLGLYIGDGYGGKTRNLQVVCKNENNTTVFNRTYAISGSYKTSPYLLHISPSVQAQDIKLYVTASMQFGTFDPITLDSEELDMLIVKTLQNHTGYPSLVVDGSLGSVNLGYDIGNGYPTYGRTLSVSATTDDNRSVFSQDYTITGSYEQTPYTININPNVWVENTVLNLTSSVAFEHSGGEDTRTITNRLTVNPQFDYNVTFGSVDGELRGTAESEKYFRGRLLIWLDYVGLGVPTGSRTVNVFAKYKNYSDTVFNYTVTLDPSVTVYHSHTTYVSGIIIGRTLDVTVTVTYKGTGGKVMTTRTDTKSYYIRS